MGLTHTGTGKSRQMINDFADYILMVHVVPRGGQGVSLAGGQGLHQQ